MRPVQRAAWRGAHTHKHVGRQRAQRRRERDTTTIASRVLLCALSRLASARRRTQPADERLLDDVAPALRWQFVEIVVKDRSTRRHVRFALRIDVARTSYFVVVVVDDVVVVVVCVCVIVVHVCAGADKSAINRTRVDRRASHWQRSSLTRHSSSFRDHRRGLRWFDPLAS